MDSISSKYDYRWSNKFYRSWSRKSSAGYACKNKSRGRAIWNQLNNFTPLLFILFSFSSLGQNWQTEVIGHLPFKTSNNAVALAYANDTPFLYSYGGIGPGLKHNDIHLSCARVNLVTSASQFIPGLPDTLGKIAAGASVVKNKIYVIGGYHVYASGGEASSNRVHVFDPEANNFESDGKNIPVPIDDHVQAVWNDSLIYVITGWSNTTNVNNVQVYNPTEDEWSVATPTPNNANYKAFGASGVIIGNTIYYLGGARIAPFFPITWTLRTGKINPNSPLEITWSDSSLSSNQRFYRSGAANVSGYPIWFGGSEITYNYDGLSYISNGIVKPSGKSFLLVSSTESVNTFTNTLPMDTRGVGELDAITKYIAGGIDSNREVTDEVIQLVWGNPATTPKVNYPDFFYPNPASSMLYFPIKRSLSLLDYDIGIYNNLGQLVLTTKESELDISSLANGTYTIQIAMDFYHPPNICYAYRIPPFVRSRLVILK